MFDFYFGTKEQIEQDDKRYLLAIKRMMPKWLNSIPDSEFIALYEVAKSICKKGVRLVETGAGASTIILAYLATQYDGLCYSWEMNSEKASQIRTIINETICKDFNKAVHDHWKCVNYLSTDAHAGLNMLNEVNEKVDLFFHDSDHVLETILAEIELISPMLCDRAIICMDDANYNFKHTNTAYINMIRTKFGLPEISLDESNISKLFHIEVETQLKQTFANVHRLEDTYKKNYSSDIYFEYFNNEFSVKEKLKMENKDSLQYRFAAWEIEK